MDNIENKRQLNFELLRIISMFLIIVFHFSDWGGIIKYGSNENCTFGYFISIFGTLGNNIFVLITGYFQINSKFKIKKLLKIILEVWFYSILLFFISNRFGMVSFNKNRLFNAIFPIVNNEYWFVTNYIGLYILSPFINKLIKNINKKQYEAFLIVFLLIFGLIPSIFNRNFLGNNLIWFIFVYLSAGYIKKYEIKIKDNKLILLVTLVLIFSIFEISLLFGNTESEILKLLKFVLALCILLLFQNIKIKDNKIIKSLANSSFAVYLLHINSNTRIYMFYKIIKIQNWYDAKLLLLIGYILYCSTLIYITSWIIDIIRRKTIEKPLFNIKIFDNIFDKIDNRINI